MFVLMSMGEGYCVLLLDWSLIGTGGLGDRLGGGLEDCSRNMQASFDYLFHIILYGIFEQVSPTALQQNCMHSYIMGPACIHVVV